MISSYGFCFLKNLFQVFNSFFCVIYLREPTSTIVFDDDRVRTDPCLVLGFYWNCFSVSSFRITLAIGFR